MKERSSGFPDKFTLHGTKFYISPIQYRVQGSEEPHRMIVEVHGDEYGKTLKAMKPESFIRGVIKETRREKRLQFNKDFKAGEIVGQKPLFHGDPLKVMPNPERYPPVEVPITQEPRMVVTHGVQSAFHPFSSYRGSLAIGLKPS